MPSYFFECPNCGHADYTGGECPVCGDRMMLANDEQFDHLPDQYDYDPGDYTDVYED